MSFYFFHKGLKEAEDLLRKGDEGSIERAQAIIVSHKVGIIDGETKEKEVFSTLISESDKYNEDLGEALKLLESDIANKRKCIELLREARKRGNFIIRLAKEIVKLCKDEELD